jgi:GGDEF domain-containing protein
MLTLGPFLRGGRSSREDALSRAFAILLNGVGQNDDDAELDATLQPLRDELGGTKDPEDLPRIAGLAVQALDEYSSDCRQRFERSLQAWRDIVRILLHRVDPPASLVADLDEAVLPGEVDALRARIETCLAEPAENAEPSAIPQAELTRLSSRIYADSTLEDADSATGLPGSRVAAKAISAIWESREHRYLVAFVLQRLESINVRFGSQAGDQIMQAYSQRLAQSLGSSDQLFRWSGTCLLALITREVPEALVAAEIARTSAGRLEKSITVRDREVIVPVSPVWSVFALQDYSGVEDVCHRVDDFIEEPHLPCSGSPAGRR